MFENLDPIYIALVIFVARLAEVSIATMRAIAVNQGRRATAFIYAFIQIVIWVYVVSKVLTNLDKTEYVMAFALGFSCGTYIGMVIESWLGQGHRMIRVFTRKGEKIAFEIRKEGFATTLFKGEGKDGPLQLLLVEVRRKRRKEILDIAKSIDPNCYYTVDAANVIPR